MSLFGKNIKNDFNENIFTRNFTANTDSIVNNAQLNTELSTNKLSVGYNTVQINNGDNSLSSSGLDADIKNKSIGYASQSSTVTGGVKSYSKYAEHEMKSQVDELLGNKRNNHLSGGVLDDTQSRTWSGNIGANHVNGSGVNVGLSGGFKSKSGDLYDNSSWGVSANGGLGVKGIGNVRLTAEAMWGKTSSSGWGGAIGVGTNSIGTPEVVADLNYVKDGVKWTIPIGGIATNIMTMNKAGLAANFVQLVNPEKLPIPQNEVIMPDTKPKPKTHIPMFEKDTVELSSAGLNYMKVMIENAKKVLQTDANAKIELGNYYDEGIFNTTNRNEKENTARQEFVRQQLIEAGIPADKIIIGHSNVNKNDVDMTIQDQYTNVRFKTTQSVSLQDAVSRAIGQFDIERASPANMEKLKAIYESAEFKAFSKGKDNLEIEFLETAVYNQHHLKGKPLNEVFSHIQENYYDKGVTLSKAAQKLSDEETIENIKKSEPYQAFIAKNPQIAQDKEEENMLLSKMLQTMKDMQYQASQTTDPRKIEMLKQNAELDNMLNIYQNEMVNKGYSFKNEQKEIEALQDELKKMEKIATKFVNKKGEFDFDKAVDYMSDVHADELKKLEVEKRKNGDKITNDDIVAVQQKVVFENQNILTYAAAIAGRSESEVQTIKNHLISFALTSKSEDKSIVNVAGDALQEYYKYNLPPEIRESIKNHFEQTGGHQNYMLQAQDENFLRDTLNGVFNMNKELMTRTLEESKRIRGITDGKSQADEIAELKKQEGVKDLVGQMLSDYKEKGLIKNMKKEEENIYGVLLSNKNVPVKDVLKNIEQEYYQNGKTIAQAKIEQELATVKGGVKAQIQGNIEQAEVAKQAPQTVEVQAQAVEAPKEKVVNIANIEQTNQQFKQDEEMKLQQQAALKQQQEQELSNSQKHTF